MATVKNETPHEQRTIQEPRHDDIHPVRVHHIHQVNSTTRIIDLRIHDVKRGIKFLPGQWLDTFIPGLPHAGGFTLTSTPYQALPEYTKHPFLQLAVRSSENPPTKWLWRDKKEIIGQDILVRVGGSFVWPPPGMKTEEIEKVVFVAGGVGINPLISMLGHLHETGAMPPKVEFLYSTRAPAEIVSAKSIPFLPQLIEISKAWAGKVELTLFLSGKFERIEDPEAFPWYKMGRFGKEDLVQALGTDVKVRNKTVCYVCGVPGMTDEFVKFMGAQEGMAPERVLCERWW